MSKKYKDLYEIEEKQNEKGTEKTVVYIGEYYRFNISDEKKRKYSLIIFIFSIIGIFLFLACGMTNGDFSRNIFLTIPFVITFMPGMLIVSSSFGLWRLKGDMTKPDYKRKFCRIRSMALLNIILNSIILVESIVILIFSGSFPETEDLLFIIFCLLGLSVYMVILVTYRKMDDIEMIEKNR